MTNAPGRAGSLVAHNVSKRYGSVTALDDVSLDVAPGECVALVGESGAGKTTLLRCFNRLVRPDSGTVRVGGIDVATIDPVRLRRGIGYVQQDGGLLPHWRVRRNVALVPWLEHEPRATSLADEALQRVGLAPATFADRWPAQLSGGQRQRVAIARALAAQPRIVLFDEPFGALDAITRGELHEQFIDLRNLTDMTAVLVTHDIHEAMRLADRVAVLRAGRIEQIATPQHMVAAPRTDYVARLIARGIAPLDHRYSRPTPEQPRDARQEP